MNEYRHHVSGFFADGEQANSAFSALLERGLPRERLNLFEAPTPMVYPVEPRSDVVLKDVLVDGAIGSAVGTGIGVLAEVALVAANVTLFVASPLVAPLVLLGWGASLGGFIGAAVGAGERKEPFSALVSDAVSSGQTVLVAETTNAQETEIARQVIQSSVGRSNDVSTA